jgi:hypothetical protein
MCPEPVLNLGHLSTRSCHDASVAPQGNGDRKSVRGRW